MRFTMLDHDEAVRRVIDFEHREALRIIDAEFQSWGYSLTRLPKYLTLEQALKIVGAA